MNGNTPWDNLSSYINTYVDELKYQHEEWFLEEKDDLKHFDALDNNLWKYPSKNDPIPDEDDRYELLALPETETKLSLLGNLFLSNGKSKIDILVFNCNFQIKIPK